VLCDFSHTIGALRKSGETKHGKVAELTPPPMMPPLTIQD